MTRSTEVPRSSVSPAAPLVPPAPPAPARKSSPPMAREAAETPVRAGPAPGAATLGRKLTPAEVALVETFVIPRYLEKFGEAALGMILLGGASRIAHFGCRTGYPDQELLELTGSCAVVGLDASLAAIELARNKAATVHASSLDYQVATAYPTSLASGAFSHALSLHPIGRAEDRRALFGEMERVLYSGGQAIVSLPLRGSFQEIGDLFREYALKHDHGEFGRAAEASMHGRPTLESLSDELEAAGFDDVDVDVRQVTLSFESGRAFTEDPVARTLVFPELRCGMGVEDFTEPLLYLNDAIGKYWSRRDFEVQVVIGTASARKG